MMDLDQASLVTRFDAQDKLLRALAVTQGDHTRRLTRLEDGQRRLEDKFGRLEDKFDRLEGRVGGLEGGQRDLQGAVARVEVGLQTIITLLSNGHGA